MSKKRYAWPLVPYLGWAGGRWGSRTLAPLTLAFGVSLLLPLSAFAQATDPLSPPPLSPSSPTAAPPARLDSWDYQPETGRLEVTTTGAVRPSLFILQNPPRVVVDFPNTRLGRDPQSASYPGRVQTLQVSQMTDTVTRFVMTVDPSQPLTLQQLQLQTADPQRWAVQFTNAANLALPTANITSGSPPPPLSTPIPRFTPLLPLVSSTPLPTPIPRFTPLLPPGISPPPLPATPPLPSVTSSGGVEVLAISTLEEGFLVKTTGSASASVRRIADPDRILIDLLDTTLSKALSQRNWSVNRLGVSRVRVGQFEPTVTRVVLEVDPSAGDWETIYDPQQGGIRIVPAGGQQQSSLLPDAPSNYQGSLATIQSVQLQGSQLTITADGFLFYRSGWDPSSGGYRISVTPARLPATLPDPNLPADGPVERIRFLQESPQTVSILVQPAQEFTVIESAPGQGTRRIDLQLQAADGSTFSFSAPTIPAGQAIVALDAGHGGRDPGAVGVDGIQEKHITLSVAQQVAQRLQAKGIGVVLTRTDDREILLQPRVDTAVASQASILVSIHANALDRSGVSGIETYYLRPDSARLATVMHQNMVQATGAADRGVRRARFFMVRETPTTMPSVLLEMGYVTNPAEGRRLASPEYQAQLAQAIAQGIEQYLRGTP
ncbi:MAG: N-acetylmuramoyl-L-alanine amidase [Cyanobacteriota bacterium]|nr:N-acetylmuramoyl-L-alanine amidase [Cyanobacteriota bacterium]